MVCSSKAAGFSLYRKLFVNMYFLISVPPKFIQDPVDQQVLKTYTTYLTCLTSGTPPPRIDWSKSIEGRFVPVSMGKPRFRKMLNGTLVISNASDEDDGKYLCTAYNGVSDTRVSKPVQLTVHGMKRSVCEWHFYTFSGQFSVPFVRHHKFSRQYETCSQNVRRDWTIILSKCL